MTNQLLQKFVLDAIFPGLMKRSSLPAARLRISQIISSPSYALDLTGVLLGYLFWVTMLYVVPLRLELSFRLAYPNCLLRVIPELSR
jgi:hypothetical protein